MEAVVLIFSTKGAHQASIRVAESTPKRRRHILGLALAGSIIGSLAATPGVDATTTTGLAPNASSTALTTSAIDKPWYSVERFYLGLVNCTRTGGWVVSDGTCRGYGSGKYSAYVAPLAYSYGLSDLVSRPYARLLVLRGLCSHTADGDPGYRLRRAGYMRWNWGENIGCRDGYSTAKAAVLASHLKFQAEKPTNGGPRRDPKNAKNHW